MVCFTILTLALAASTVIALPLDRRIAQIIDQSTALWEQACVRHCLTFPPPFRCLTKPKARCRWKPAVQPLVNSILRHPPRQRRSLRPAEPG
jgi:hypothetical protein